MHRVEVPIGHAVVEEDAGVAGGHARAPGAVDALDAGDGVALAVGGAEIGRVARRIGDGADRRSTLPIDTGSEPGGVIRRQQFGEGRVAMNFFKRARVGAPALAIGESELFRLDQHMHEIGRAEPHGFQIEMFDDLQLL